MSWTPSSNSAAGSRCGRRHPAHLNQPRGAARLPFAADGQRREGAPARPRGRGEAGRTCAERRRRGRRCFQRRRGEEIEQLVDAVNCHARTLALLAPALRDRGVEATRASLVELMAEMERRFPGSREQSVFASVELSLQRLSPASRDRARVLGVFHGAVDLDVLRMMMAWKKADVAALAVELIATGLATPNRYNHLTLTPARQPLPAGAAGRGGTRPLTARWVEAMGQYAKFLEQQSNQNAEMAATLTLLELPNLFALLDRMHAAGDAEATIGLATSLYSLLSMLGKPLLLARVGQVPRRRGCHVGGRAGRRLAHARFEAARTRIEQQLDGWRLREAFDGAQALLQRARAAGDQAYSGADYDLAMATNLLGQVLQATGGLEQALPLYDDAREAFEAITTKRESKGAERMASICYERRGQCLVSLGRLDEAAAAYEENIRRARETR